MLVPPSERPLKTVQCAFFAYVHPPTPANSPLDLRGYSTKVHEIFIRRRAIIGGVNAIIDVAILPTVVVCQRRE